MTVDKVFQLLLYRASKSGFTGTISSNDFNLIFPSAELRFYNKLFGNINQYRYGDPVPPISYPETLKVSTSLSKFKSGPIDITIDSGGQYQKTDDMFFIDSISHIVTGGTKPTPIKRVEQQDLSGNLYSYYQAPTETFPIYVEYSDYIQFYPIDLATATLNYLIKPIPTFWGSTLSGGIGLINTLVAGTGYTNGTYPNVNFTGGTGNSARGTVTVAGGMVTAVSITYAGFGYVVGDTLTGAVTGGTGWSFDVATIVNAREAYDSGSSTDPVWADNDIDEIIYMALKDAGQFLKDVGTEQFAMVESKSGGI